MQQLLSRISCEKAIIIDNNIFMPKGMILFFLMKAVMVQKFLKWITVGLYPVTQTVLSNALYS